jgi:hypothetical protein
MSTTTSPVQDILQDVAGSGWTAQSNAQSAFSSAFSGVLSPDPWASAKAPKQVKTAPAKPRKNGNKNGKTSNDK